MRLTNHDPGYQPWVISANKPTWRAIYDKLCAYEDAGEQGRLVILPCKVGDTFFFLSETIHGELYVAQSRVSDIVITGDALMIVDTDGCYHYTYWFTREEAEAALKGGKDDGTA